MEMNEIALGLLIGIAGSLVAAVILKKYQEKRQQNIQRKIEELDYEEKFIEKISKGNIELIRSGFRVFSLCLFMIFSSGAAVLVTNLFSFPEPLKMLIYLLAVGAWAASAGGCLSYFHSLNSLTDVKAAKEKISNKRQKLSNKL